MYRMLSVDNLSWNIAFHKAKTTESTIIPLLTLGVQGVKYVSHCKYLGIQRTKQRHSETTILSILCNKQAASFFFPMFERSEKMYLFVSSLRPCMRHNQWRTQKIFMGGFIQWHMVVICIWCALFVTSQYDVIFMFINQRFGDVC